MLRESESFSNLADEVAYQKTMAALLTLAAAASAAYMQPIVGARGAVSRASPVNMQMQKRGRGGGAAPPPPPQGGAPPPIFYTSYSCGHTPTLVDTRRCFRTPAYA